MALVSYAFRVRRPCNPSQSTFAVPDLRGRVPLGAGQTSGGAVILPGTVDTLTVGDGSAALPYLAVNYIICYNGIFPMRDN